MLPRGPYADIDRFGIALGLLLEVRQVEDVDAALTSRSREDLLCRASSGDLDAYAELTRREPVAA